MSKDWSPQQQAFLDFAATGTGSCILVAVAGAGKTTVLLEAGANYTGGNVLYMAYNKDVADETSEKLKERGVDWKQMVASTVHSAGMKVIRKACPEVRVNENKVRDLFDQKAPALLQHRQGEVLQLVSLAKQSAFGSAGPALADVSAWLQMASHFDVWDDEHDTSQSAILSLVELAQKLLEANNQIIDVVDYDDMVYLPPLLKLSCWRYSLIVLDEAQDTNAARRALVRMLLRRGGRVFAVGDPCQAIYGFTGADANAMDLIKQDFNAIELPLTITYRCPKTVVEFVQQWVSHISAADTAPLGEYAQTSLDAFVTRNDLNGCSAVLCRNNKPLVSLAFNLLRRRIPCKIAGRDIGGSLTKLLGRWKVSSLDALEDRLDAYLAKQTTKLLARKQESKVAALEDQIETCKVILQACRSQRKFQVKDAIDWVEGMFTDSRRKDLLMLSSIHKSKGREWENVFWLDRASTCPNKWARQDWQQQQEIHLQYVAGTRSKDKLIEILVEHKREES